MQVLKLPARCCLHDTVRLGSDNASVDGGAKLSVGGGDRWTVDRRAWYWAGVAANLTLNWLDPRLHPGLAHVEVAGTDVAGVSDR
jgi:hypothetical protein